MFCPSYVVGVSLHCLFDPRKQEGGDEFSECCFLSRDYAGAIFVDDHVMRRTAQREWL
jgi:hypothetical protein